MTFKISPKNRNKQFLLLIKNAEERIQSAELLFGKGLYNDAVSRAYYGFLDTANALLITKGITAKTHAGVITLFSLHFIKTKLVPVQYIQFFRQAKDAREEADYEFLKRFTEKETKQILQTAKEFIRFVKDNFSKIQKLNLKL